MSKISIIIPVYWNSDTLMTLYRDMEEKMDQMNEIVRKYIRN